MAHPPDLIASSEACRILGVDKSTLTRWVAADDIDISPAQKLPGRTGAFLFHRDDVERLAAERAEASA